MAVHHGDDGAAGDDPMHSGVTGQASGCFTGQRFAITQLGSTSPVSECVVVDGHGDVGAGDAVSLASEAVAADVDERLSPSLGWGQAVVG
jgi:hypothetical protein